MADLIDRVDNLQSKYHERVLQKLLDLLPVH
jgi:hypothetical protein